MGEDFEEMKNLLREIRDLQKGHFERYVAFTEQIVQSQKHSADNAARSQTEQDAYLRQQLAYQEEMRHTVRNSQRNGILVLVVAFGLLAFIGASYVFVNVLLTGASIQP